MNLSWMLVPAVLGVLVFAELSLADVLELTTGERVEGLAAQATSDRVTIEVGGQTLSFERAKVRAIYFGAAPATATAPSLAAEALRALKSLQSVVQGGVVYREYATRVNDAKIQVDRYTEAESARNNPDRAPLAAAMAYYVIASSVWNRTLTKNYLAGDLPGAAGLPLEECQPLRAALPPLKDAADRQDPKKTREFMILVLKVLPTIESSYVSLLWSCASGKIAEAERLLK